MALTVCKECNGGVSTTAKVCPHCGAKVKSGIFGKILLGFIGILIFGHFISGFSNNNAEKKEAQRIASLSPEQREAERKANEAKEAKRIKDELLGSAKYMCQQFVLKSLHDPKGAELDRTNRYYYKDEGNNTYFIQVTGRAKNGFGALRQSVFDCRVKLVGDRWVLKSLKEH